MRKAVVVALSVVMVGGIAAGAMYGIVRATRGDDTARVRAFFTLPARTSCADESIDITIDKAHFAAFIPGSGVPAKEGKFLLLRVTVTSRGTAPPPGVRRHFAAQTPSGARYGPVAIGGDPWSALPMGQPVTGELAFDVPAPLGAAKLVYDDGCTHEEWVVP